MVLIPNLIIIIPWTFWVCLLNQIPCARYVRADSCIWKWWQYSKNLVRAGWNLVNNQSSRLCLDCCCKQSKWRYCNWLCWQKNPCFRSWSFSQGDRKWNCGVQQLSGTFSSLRTWRNFKWTACQDAANWTIDDHQRKEEWRS